MDILKARQELMLGQTIYDMSLRVVDYGRVSTDKDDQLNSLENQINYFNDMISSIEKWQHVGSYIDEGISGTQVKKREQFLKMIADAKAGKFDVILTKEVSRFARNTIDSIKYTQDLLKYGVIVVFISDNINTIYPDSEFRLTLMASMAQDEVRKLSERVKFGIKRSIKDGKVGGSRLYGYIKKDCTLTINQYEAPAVKILFSLYSTNLYGLNKIGKILAEKGYYTKKGKVFSEPTLKKMLRNPRYKGWYTANLSEVEDYKTHKKKIKPKEEWIMYKDQTGKIPAIISEELWNKANKILEQRNSRHNKNALNKESFLEHSKYSSKIYCMEHNTIFIKSGSGKRKDNPVWQCNEYLRHGIKGCSSPILYEKYLDQIFTYILEIITGNKEQLFNIIKNDYIEIIKETNEGEFSRILSEKIKEYKIYKENLLDMSLRKLINDEEFLEKNKKINSEISSLNNELKKIEESKKNVSYYKSVTKNIEKIIKNKMDIKNNLDKYFNIFIDKVFVSKINNNRKHLKLKIIYNFKRSDEEIEIKITKNKIDINVIR